ncbi:bacillopeptidase F [Desmospora profundinema]|uniref:Bacillopeptidase F n=1 Tax=Desmospora profundinema TaxID=1571184 RepID=A0ABU1IHA7_9BACL|nr:S8 family serine peptidase [Desmospora profundinema]MDR6224162.1 bacillopeptidase F [Desmospora profundinema]
MQVKSKSVRFLFIWTICFALLLSLALPPTAAEANGKPHTSVNEAKEVKPEDKVNKRLQKQFSEKNTVTFLVKMKEQADTEKAAQEAAKQAKKQKLTRAQSKQMKRSAVVSELRIIADETQHELKQYLQKKKKAGKVKEFQTFYVVNALAVTANETVMKDLAQFPEVEKILPNETRQIIGLEEKKGKNQPQSASIEWNVEQIGAPQVWAMGIDGSGTVVASIDSGVQWDHPALKEKYRGYDPANPNQPNHAFNWFDAVNGQAAPYDDLDHGTHVTGTMVGQEPDGSNTIGVAPGAQWIAVKAFSAAGGTDVDLLAAGEWILAPKDADGNPHPEKAPDVVNNSWGGGRGLNEWYRPMVQNWRAAEIFPEFSAGNTTLFNPGGPGSVANPANYPESFATGATDINKRLASFSLQGPSPYDEIKPEISAPGVNIRSSVSGSGYQGGWNGTSMSGPHVSATVALLKQANASLTVDELEEILLSTAEPLTDSTFPESPNNGYGHGLVDAFGAVSSVVSGLGEIRGQVVEEGEDTEPPTYEHEAPVETYNKMNLPLTVQARDNVSVTEVQLEYRYEEKWKKVTATRTAGHFRDGTYQAVIPGDHVTKPSLTYRWKIRDFGGNETVSNTYDVTVKPGITVGYTQDFESKPDGWYSFGENNSWQWGVPTSGPGQAASGENVYATNLSGNYANNANMTLMMPPVDLPEGDSFLTFQQWYNLEARYDFGHLLISTDQENWTQLLRQDGTTDGWQQTAVDLSEYAGQRIYLAFNVTTDSSIVRPGWYIDDIALTDEASEVTQTGLDKRGGKTDKSKNKHMVDPDTLLPAKQKAGQIAAPESQASGERSQIIPAALPLGAQVSVLETGRSVTTNPQDGSYRLLHPAGEFTVRAETYGYRSADQRVLVERDGTTTANFVLEPIPRGTITGTVTNERTGEPITHATIYLREDAAVQPVQTDENGRYTLEAYEGSYTLHVSAPGYYSSEAVVKVDGSGQVEQEFSLKPFIGVPGEIGYDDGTAENARAFYDAGNGWAVRMSLEEGREQAMVTAGVFRFWDTEWPVPGGTDFQVAVYDASGADGAPGKKLAGPIDATANRDGSWTTVDLSDQGVIVDDDFYIVYIQTHPNPNTPGLATDENGPHTGRSWQWVGGSWSPTPTSEGNYMIRARVDYEVTAPTITSPADGNFTNQERITVEGKASPSTNITLYNNGTEAGSAPIGDDGTFAVEISLTEGENELTAVASTERGETDPSTPVTVILDQDKPALTIDKPIDGWKTNREAVTVAGTATDAHLDWVKVNGSKAKMEEDGSYSLRILLEEGENLIEVTAADKAGNKQSRQIRVDAKFAIDPVKNLKPEEDIYLKSGESVKIQFDSEPGLKGTYIVHMPLTNLPANATELPLQEQGDGHYVGYWTATSNLKDIRGAVVEVILKDDYGNEVRKRAEGKLFINTKKKK